MQKRTASLDRGRLAELARVFLKLGAISFGGPAAHIALMRREFVERRGWLTPQEFLDLVGATNLIPGPNSTEMAIHIGRLRSGWRGLVVAGACFILPLMGVVCARLGMTSITDIPTALLAIASVAASVVWRINPMWLAIIGAAIGLLRAR